MRYAIVTETYPPEVNGVALTVQGLERGLRARGNEVDVVRPYQPQELAQPHELLVRGLAHAWSGGAAQLPFSDPLGPDASRMAWAFAAAQFRG